jgi:hypothetical protein
MKLNSKMSALLKEADISTPLNDGLALGHVESPAFEIAEGSVVLRTEFEKNRHVSVTAFPDRTGFESFINHVHLPFNGTRESLLACLAYTDALRRGLTRLVGSRHFQVIVSIAGNGCTVRFHEVRFGERWIAENLEDYADEAILVLDVP